MQLDVGSFTQMLETRNTSVYALRHRSTWLQEQPSPSEPNVLSGKWVQTHPVCTSQLRLPGGATEAQA